MRGGPLESRYVSHDEPHIPGSGQLLYQYTGPRGMRFISNQRLVHVSGPIVVSSGTPEELLHESDTRASYQHPIVSSVSKISLHGLDQRWSGAKGNTKHCLARSHVANGMYLHIAIIALVQLASSLTSHTCR